MKKNKVLNIFVLFFTLIFLSFNSSISQAGSNTLEWSDNEICNSFFVLNQVFNKITFKDSSVMAQYTIVSFPKPIHTFKYVFIEGIYALGTLCSFIYKDQVENLYRKVYYFVWRDSLRPSYIETGNIISFPMNLEDLQLKGTTQFKSNQQIQNTQNKLQKKR